MFRGHVMRVTIVGKGDIGQADRRRFGQVHAVTMTESGDARLANASALADMVLIAEPLGFDPKTHRYDTGVFRALLAELRQSSPDSIFVLRFPVPQGFCDAMATQYGERNLVVAPQLLTEHGVIGGDLAACERAAVLLSPDATPEFCSVSEAEAMSLALESYLATRQAFVNEIDTLAMAKGLNADEILATLAAMPTLGLAGLRSTLNAVATGLPGTEDELAANQTSVPEGLMRAVLDANTQRAKVIAESLTQKARAFQDQHKAVRARLGLCATNLRPCSPEARIADLVAMNGVDIDLIDAPAGVKSIFDAFLLGEDLLDKNDDLRRKPAGVPQ